MTNRIRSRSSGVTATLLLVVATVSPSHASVSGPLLAVGAAITGQTEEAADATPRDRFIEEVNAELDADGDAATQPADDAGAEPARGGLYYLRVISALCLVVGLIIAAGYVIRKAGGNTPLLAGASLGRILGRIYLARNATVYFVETGGRVLLLGVTNAGINTLATFSKSDFSGDTVEDEDAEEIRGPEDFLQELGKHTGLYRQPESNRAETDINTLRHDIERLQEYLREESGESRD